MMEELYITDHSDPRQGELFAAPEHRETCRRSSPQRAALVTLHKKRFSKKLARFVDSVRVHGAGETASGEINRRGKTKMGDERCIRRAKYVELANDIRNS